MEQENKENTVNATMSQELNSQSQIDKEFCKGCLFIIKNIFLINSHTELSEAIKMDKLENAFGTSLISEHSSVCKFCVGIMNVKNFNSIFEKIKNLISDYDHKDYKITTNFSPLFHILHNYVRKK
jgi:tRNA U54 and U55 pseudouridine synthase Pus10